MDPQLDSEELKFRSLFNNYLKSVPSDILGPMMIEHPGEAWRVKLIKRSGLELPKRVAEAVERFDEKNEEREKYLSL